MVNQEQLAELKLMVGKILDGQGELNVEYVENISILLDFKILFLTILTVIGIEDKMNVKEVATKNQQYCRD